MTFAQIPAGASIFLDANTLVYHFTKEPKDAARRNARAASSVEAL